jgi:hypothetical protein
MGTPGSETVTIGKMKRKKIAKPRKTFMLPQLSGRPVRSTVRTPQYPTEAI